MLQGKSNIIKKIQYNRHTENVCVSRVLTFAAFYKRSNYCLLSRRIEPNR